MVYMDDSTIRINGVTLPGIYKGVEVTTDAMVEEQEVEGSSVKPKQATGYEDAKVKIDLELYDSMGGMTAEQKLETIQNLFRTSGQAKPQVHEMVSIHASARGVKQVIIKNMTSKVNNKNDKITVSLELWEYVPVVIRGTKKTNKKASTKAQASGLNSNYKSYLSDSRGVAPKSKSKTSATAAVDDRSELIREKLAMRKGS